MSNPWDQFPFPARADEKELDTFAGVGAVMTCWEGVEFEFARLYGVFVGGNPDGMGIREYGEPRIAKDRFDKLSKVSESFFVAHPNQSDEGDFDTTMTAALGFSSRRNDVAHGMVMNVSKIRFFQERIRLMKRDAPQYVLVPPYHTLRNHDHNGLPSYAYNGAQLAELGVRMVRLERAIKRLRTHLLRT